MAMSKIFTLLSLLVAIINESNVNISSYYYSKRIPIKSKYYKKINPKENHSISIRESTNEIKELVKKF